MDKAKNVLALLGIGVVIGVILTVVFVYVLKATPSTIAIGPVEFDLSNQALTQTTNDQLTLSTTSPTRFYPTATLHPTNTFSPPTITYTPTLVPTQTPDPRLFWDDFESGISPDWEFSGDNYFSVNGMLVNNGILEGFVGNSSWEDYSITLFGVNYYWNDWELPIRVQDRDNYMLAKFFESNGCFFSWSRVVNGIATDIPGTSYKYGLCCSFCNGHQIEIEVDDNVYRTFINGEMRMRFVDDTFSNGGIGLRTNAQFELDGIEIKTLP